MSWIYGVRRQRLRFQMRAECAAVTFLRALESRGVASLAHELEHLVNASRRMYVNTPFVALEEVWLDEGLAHMSEELVFFAVASLSPRANVGVSEVGAVVDEFFQYEEPTFAKLRQWLLSPHTSGFTQSDNDDATRSQAYAFSATPPIAKAAPRPRSGRDWSTRNRRASPISKPTSPPDPAPWIADFAAATYSDDATTGVSSQFTQSSWKFREIFEALDYDPGAGCSSAYPLTTRNPSTGVTDSFSLTSRGPSAYWRAGVVGTRAMIKARANDNGALPSDLQLGIFRRE